MKPLVSIIPEPDRSVEKRRPLTRAEFGQLMIDQSGRCGCGCGERLQPLTEKVIDEHLISLAAGGTNDLTNRRLYRKPCATAKTKADQGVIASVKRLEARETGTRRPRKPIPQAASPWPPKGSRKLPTKKARRALEKAAQDTQDPGEAA